MKNLFRFAIVGLMLAAVPFTACKDDDDDNIECTETYFNDRTTELTEALDTAANNYNNDPSNANCNAFRDAYQDYVDFLRDFTDCAVELGEDQGEWNDSIEALEDILTLIEC